MKMNIIITMAGNSRRFREAGFTQPKYEIQAHGRTLFEWSMLSLSQFWQRGARAIFVTRQEFNARPFIEAHAPLCGISEYSVIELDEATAGQLLDCAALHARSPDGTLLRNERPERLRSGILARLPPLGS